MGDERGDQDQAFEQATAAIRAEYARSARQPKPSPGAAMRHSRLRHYDALLSALGLVPLGERRVLDMGCANGGWLMQCCTRWGAAESRCVGIDLRSDLIAQWQAEHPDSRITLHTHPAHELDFPPGAFDLIHQSMMLSSIPHAPLRERVAETMWQLLKPGGHILSYDFWLNPINRATLGIRRRELARLFPEAQFVAARTITLAPPLARVLTRIGLHEIQIRLERLRFLNTHYLVALKRDA